MSAFEAKFGGKCDGCGARIIPGQLVVFVDDELVHLECEPWALRTAAEVDVCPVCWLVKPCGCTDDRPTTLNDSSVKRKLTADER